MGEHSIEHNLTFNTAKRILKFVDPSITVVASKELKGNDTYLDLVLNMLYVPEGRPLRAAGMILFYAGLLRLKATRFGMTSVFGNINPALEEKDLIQSMALEHFEADDLAYKWALKQFMLLFPETEEPRAKVLVDHRLTQNEWTEYFSSEDINEYRK